MRSQSAGATGEQQRPTPHRERRADEPQAEDADGTAQPVDLSLDMIFDVLKNQRRRRVLQHLDEHEGAVRLGELAEHIAALENDTSVAALSSSERKTVYVGLYQCHLPKLDDLDVVAFNKNRGIIERGANATRLKAYLDRPSSTRPWYQYYAAIGGLGLLVVATTQLSTVLPTTGLFLAVLFAFLACATAHTYTEDELFESDSVFVTALRGRISLVGDLRMGHTTARATNASASATTEATTGATAGPTDEGRATGQADPAAPPASTPAQTGPVAGGDTVGEREEAAASETGSHDPTVEAGGQTATGNSDGAAAPTPPEPAIDIPGETTLSDVKAAVRSAETLYEVQQALDLEREETLDLLRELDLLELVHGRVATKRRRDELKDGIPEQLSSDPGATSD